MVKKHAFMSKFTQLHVVSPFKWFWFQSCAKVSIKRSKVSMLLIMPAVRVRLPKNNLLSVNFWWKFQCCIRAFDIFNSKSLNITAYNLTSIRLKRIKFCIARISPLNNCYNAINYSHCATCSRYNLKWIFTQLDN